MKNKVPKNILRILDKCRCATCGYPVVLTRRRNYKDHVDLVESEVLKIKTTPHRPNFSLACSRHPHDQDGLLSFKERNDLIEFIEKNGTEINMLEVDE